MYKLNFFVPCEYKESVKEALFAIAQMMRHTNIEMLIHKYNKFIPSEVKKIDKSIGLF